MISDMKTPYISLNFLFGGNIVYVSTILQVIIFLSYIGNVCKRFHQYFGAARNVLLFKEIKMKRMSETTERTKEQSDDTKELTRISWAHHFSSAALPYCLHIRSQYCLDMQRGFKIQRPGSQHGAAAGTECLRVEMEETP